MLVLMFQAGDLRFAFEAHLIEHVGACATPRPLPEAPPWYAGMLVFRGKPTPILDLGRLLMGVPCPIRMSTRLLFLRLSGATVGLLAERVTPVTLDARSLEAANDDFAAQNLRGRVLLDEQGLFQLIDPQRLLQPEQTALLLR